MSRSYNYLNDKYKGLTESDLWKLLFCSAYALKELFTKYGKECDVPRISVMSLCCDGRRTPTVRKSLMKANLMVGNSPDDNLEPIVEEVEKILQTLSTKEPQFNTSGYITKKEYSWKSDNDIRPITDLGEVYLDLHDLDAYEIIHVYLNQQLYDIREFKVNRTHTNHRGYYGSSKVYTSYYLKIYPLSYVNPASDASVIAAGEAFSKKHARETLSAAFNLKFRAINDEKEYTTKEAIDKRIDKVEEKIRLLQRTRKELRVLQAKATTLGDEALKKLTIDTSIKYIKRKAPLWMNSDDTEKKKLAMLVLKGVSINTEVNV